MGTFSETSVDYPDYAKKVAKAVIKNKAKGILICGTGTGMVIVANKVKGIRAVVAYDNGDPESMFPSENSKLISIDMTPKKLELNSDIKLALICEESDEET